MKKILSIVLAVALVLALAVPAFASEDIRGEVLFTAEGPKTATNWWYDAWFDTEQKIEFSSVVTGGTANYIVAVFEGDLTSGAEGAGFQIGIQTNTDWTLHLFHSNWELGEGQVGDATLVECVNGKSYVYLDIATLLTNLTETATNFSLAENNSSYSFIVGAPSDYPLLGVYVVNAEIAVEEPVEDTTVVETPAEDEPADTGLALAVVPMIVAMAAIVASKRR